MIETAIDTQQVLSDIYSEIIEFDGVNKDSPFLDVGGNSINVVKLVQEIKQATGVEISVEDMFEDDLSSFNKVLEFVAGQLNE